MSHVRCPPAKNPLVGLCLAAGLGLSGATAAAAGTVTVSVIEEVIVTAQRVEENVQDVPIAVTALTRDDLIDRQVITPSDVQLNAPNVTFTATNFGGSSFGIRGVGNLVLSRAGEPGVSTHVNEIALPPNANLNSLEFFDMLRVEVLRGPQGTLYGRNATGGSVNFVTAPAELGKATGFVELESGEYSHQRVKGMVNIAFGERLALRVAGYKLLRDGFIENLAYGQVDAHDRTLPDIDQDIDGRDIGGTRATLNWDLTDRAAMWVMFSRFAEDDDRARISSQVCKRSALPVTGCLPDEFGWEQPHLGTTTFGIFAAAAGAMPFGVDGSDPSLYDYPRPAITGYRQMHTDFEPVYESDEDLLAFGFTYEFDLFDFTLIGADSNTGYISQQDLLMDVGPSLGATPLNPSGVWPVSRPAGGTGAEWLSDSCNLVDGTSGVLGGCIQRADGKRVFAFDQLDITTDYWTVEARLRSAFAGPANFLLGVNWLESTSYSGLYVFANTLDMVTLYGSSLLDAPPMYPGFFLNANDPARGDVLNARSAFGEVYLDVSDRLQLTAGVRFNEDDNSISDTSALFNSIDVNALFGGVLGAGPVWLRADLVEDIGAVAAGTATSLSDDSLRLLEFWNAGAIYAQHGAAAVGSLGAVEAARIIGSFIEVGLVPPELLPDVLAELPLPAPFQASVGALLSQDPATIAADPGLVAGRAAFRAIADAVWPVPGFGETRFITGSPTEATWDNVSGRLGADYRLTNEVLLYLFYDRGFKSGGFNAAVPPAFQASTAFTFDSEAVDSFEFGVKSFLLDDHLMLNAAAFYYDYTGLQVTRIRNNTAVNDNIDASAMGLELEGLWQAESLPGLSADFAYGWLVTEVGQAFSLDPINRTGGNADYIALNNIDPGATTGVNYVARESQITSDVVLAGLATGAALDLRNGRTVQSASYPANAAGVSIPAYFSRDFLNSMGVETLDGVPVDIAGNRLPNAPEHNLRLGVAHTWSLVGGTLGVRWDWYWQADSYAREFNTKGDEIESWAQHNATATYVRDNVTVRLWVRNVLNDDNVTGKFVTTDTSGFFRNYFLTEPRIYGLSLRLDLGG